MLYHEIKSKFRELTLPQTLDGYYKVYCDLPSTVHKLINAIDGDLLMNKNKPSANARFKKAELEQILRDLDKLKTNENEK